jgi:hypothetical protein
MGVTRDFFKILFAPYSGLIHRSNLPDFGLKSTSCDTCSER